MPVQNIPPSSQNRSWVVQGHIWKECRRQKTRLDLKKEKKPNIIHKQKNFKIYMFNTLVSYNHSVLPFLFPIFLQYWSILIFILKGLFSFSDHHIAQLGSFLHIQMLSFTCQLQIHTELGWQELSSIATFVVQFTVKLSKCFTTQNALHDTLHYLFVFLGVNDSYNV